MATINKLIANQQNALQSTGPKSLAGISKSSRNALRHGFYSAAIVPAAGESVEEFETLRASVYEELAPEGIMEARLVDKVVMTLWRFDRVTRYEAAVAANAIGAREGPLPPDPDAITGDEVDICLPPREGSPPAYRLSYARARLKGWKPVREAFRVAASALSGEGGQEVLLPLGARAVVWEIGELVGWEGRHVNTKWDAAVAARTSKEPLAGNAFKDFVMSLARAAGLDPAIVVQKLQDLATAKVKEFDKVIAEKTAEEAVLVAQMRAARNAALAAGLYADGDAVERVMRMEAHLTRQLGLTLDLLERLRGDGSGRGEDGVGLLVRRVASLGAAPLLLPGSVGSFRDG